jgi:hypothetical protein
MCRGAGRRENTGLTLGGEVAAAMSPRALGAPNKPMVPTAPTSLAEPALRSRRRHIGQPFGSATAERATDGTTV